MYLVEKNRCIYFTTYAYSMSYETVWNITKTAVFPADRLPIVYQLGIG